MKNKLITVIAATATIGFSSKASAQIPVTDVLHIGQGLAAHVAEYASMAAQYAQQIQQYQTQVEQFNLQEIASQTFDTNQFGSTMGNLDEYGNAFDLSDSKQRVGGLENYSDMVASGTSQTSEQYLERLGLATDRKLELSNAQSELATKRMDSIETDRDNLQQLQNANANAAGEMEAAQIGNHINSEMVGQMVKMRQEQAAESQIQAEKDALDASIQAEQEAKRLALVRADKVASDERKNRPQLDSQR